MKKIQRIILALLYEFPLQELDVFFPSWVDSLRREHPIKKGLVELVSKQGNRLTYAADGGDWIGAGDQ